jgi:hypothetical protein
MDNWTDRTVRATIESMSVPDAAPLPRLGEVFFDVRGNSRSMRLSWYADTGVAVFSIWQAGMCTGTFRLPIADLGRMIDLLQRGPAPRRRGPVPVASAERVDPGFDRPSGSHRSASASDEAGPGSRHEFADFSQGDFASDYGAADYPAAAHQGGVAEQHAGQHYQGGDYRAERENDYSARGYGADERTGPGYTTDYTDQGYHDTHDRQYTDRDYGAPGYGRAEPSQPEYRVADPQADYGRGDYRTDDGYRQPSYEPADYGSRGHSPDESDYATGDYSTGGFGAGRGADQGRDYPAGGGGYRDDRVVAPYVQDQEQPYLNDNWAPAGDHHGDIDDPVYPADRQPVSPSYGYQESSGSQDSYSYGSDYRYRLSADTGPDEENSVGRPSGRRAG